MHRQALRTICGAMILAVSVASAGCSQACPVALLEGTLTEQDGDLVVMRDDGVVGRVDWSASGHHVRRDGEQLVVADWLGAKARDGDFVHLGGGEYESGLWRVCGSFEVGGPAG